MISKAMFKSMVQVTDGTLQGADRDLKVRLIVAPTDTFSGRIVWYGRANIGQGETWIFRDKCFDTPEAARADLLQRLATRAASFGLTVSA